MLSSKSRVQISFINIMYPLLSNNLVKIIEAKMVILHFLPVFNNILLMLRKYRSNGSEDKLFNLLYL